jgi:hypothetical protein
MLQLQGLRKSAEKLVELDQETSDRFDVCSEVRRRVLRELHYGEPAGNDLDLYKSELDRRERQRPAPQNSNGGRYLKDVDNAIRTITGAGDDLVVAGGRVVPSRCPITGRDVENPVANTACGHVYSTLGIIGYLWQKNGQKTSPPTSLDAVPEFFSADCPNAGCSKHVTRAALARDFITERSQRLARLGSATQHSGDHDDADEVEELVD